MSPPRQRTPSRARSTAELYTLDAPPRLGFVQYQLGLARLSVSLQVPRAARAALLVLTPADFPSDPEIARAYLTALRDPALSSADITAAVDALGDIASSSERAPALERQAGRGSTSRS
jgi:hypothetical protein